jgi:biotin transport system substrate-specific component
LRNNLRPIAKIFIEVSFATIAMWVSGQLSVDFSFLAVPITLQSLVAFLLPLLLNGRNASGGILLWLILGSLGLPVFAHASFGIDRIFSNSGGFLLGFYLISFLVRSQKNKIQKGEYVRSFITFSLLHLVLMQFGLLWIFLGDFSDITFKSHILPYLPGLVIKSALASLILDLYLRIRNSVQLK